MDKFSKRAYKDTVEEVSARHNITPATLKKIMKLYADYMFYHINSTDFQRDLGDQCTRYIFQPFGEVRVAELVILENERIFGRVTEEEYLEIHRIFHRLVSKNIGPVKQFRQQFKCKIKWKQ